MKRLAFSGKHVGSYSPQFDARRAWVESFWAPLPAPGSHWPRHANDLR